MGLDVLDLVFRLEKRFGITIDLDEGYAILCDTAGTIHRYLVAKLRGEYHEAPRIEPLAQELSTAVIRIAGRWRFTSSFDLNKRFRPADRAANWKALEEAIGVSLPALEHPPGDAFPRIPRHCDSVMSLAYWIVQHHPQRAAWFPVDCERKGNNASQQWTDEEVWTILRECICDALGVKPDDVTCDTRMVEDLGMG